ncbi:MAG: hypothetical protein UT81_C0003G0008 [Parcubacteria group bacterium GW2011_GWA2_40_14]|nr:MAG: hypothetical protein UT81_C0003G0008 [Parcubacteria group bacterium GW2011_GWA2_40_14]
MVNHIAITKARINLGLIVKRAHLNGEYFILEKYGIPIAGIMNGNEMEDYLGINKKRVKQKYKKLTVCGYARGLQLHIFSCGLSCHEFCSEQGKDAEKHFGPSS